MSFDIGPVMGLMVAENSRDPGTGRIAAVATSIHDPDADEMLNTILWTTVTRIHAATSRRFPDLAARPGWAELANHFPTDGEVVKELGEDVRAWEKDGGCLVVWDAPTTFARLAPYGFTPPERVLDLHVLNRLLLPRQTGHRHPDSMAQVLRVNTPVDMMPGVEREAQVVHHLGEALGRMTREGRLPQVPHQMYSWQDLLALQARASSVQMKGLKQWMRSQGKASDTVRMGWPVWA